MLAQAGRYKAFPRFSCIDRSLSFISVVLTSEWEPTGEVYPRPKEDQEQLKLQCLQQQRQAHTVHWPRPRKAQGWTRSPQQRGRHHQHTPAKPADDMTMISLNQAFLGILFTICYKCVKNVFHFLYLLQNCNLGLITTIRSDI